MPKYSCLNIHASLLPRWRGAAPIQRAILYGDEKTGVCIMQMEKGLDTGPILALEAIAITSSDTASSLHDKLKEVGTSLIKQVIANIEAGKQLEPVPQPEEGVIYAEKLRKEEAMIDWQRSADEIDRQVRAFNPFPVAQTYLTGQVFRIWQGHVDQTVASKSEPGTIVQLNKDVLTVACGNGFFNITELQKAGGKRLNLSAFLSGNKLHVGDSFQLTHTSISSSHSS
jgi:methionyl-tRNA formyltransferase